MLLLSTVGNNVDDDDDDNAELSDEEAADGDAAEIKLRQKREQVTWTVHWKNTLIT